MNDPILDQLENILKREQSENFIKNVDKENESEEMKHLFKDLFEAFEAGLNEEDYDFDDDEDYEDDDYDDDDADCMINEDDEDEEATIIDITANFVYTFLARELYTYYAATPEDIREIIDSIHSEMIKIKSLDQLKVVEKEVFEATGEDYLGLL